MLGLVNPQSRNDAIRNIGIIIDKSDRTHRPAHTQRSDQLISGRTRAINGYARHTIIHTLEVQYLSRVEPMTQKELT